MTEVRTLHPKTPEPATGRLAVVGRVWAVLLAGSVLVPATLAVVFGAVWASDWLIRAIAGVF